MPQQDSVETFVLLVNRYHELRDRNGMDASDVEWVRAQISGARMLLENTLGEPERDRVFKEVRTRTGRGIPHRERDWRGRDSQAQRESA